MVPGSLALLAVAPSPMRLPMPPTACWSAWPCQRMAQRTTAGDPSIAGNLRASGHFAIKPINFRSTLPPAQSQIRPQEEQEIAYNDKARCNFLVHGLGGRQPGGKERALELAFSLSPQSLFYPRLCRGLRINNFQDCSCLTTLCGRFQTVDQDRNGRGCPCSVIADCLQP